MSISELVKELRDKADIYNAVGSAWELNRAEAKKLQTMIRKAADTIEALSAKLADMGQSEEGKNKEQQYDRIIRVSSYLFERYGDKLWEEFGFEKTGDASKDMLSTMKIFDEIYKREKEKYPLMWYKYCLCANENQNNP